MEFRSGRSVTEIESFSEAQASPGKYIQNSSLSYPKVDAITRASVKWWITFPLWNGISHRPNSTRLTNAEFLASLPEEIDPAFSAVSRNIQTLAEPRSRGKPTRSSWPFSGWRLIQHYRRVEKTRGFGLRLPLFLFVVIVSLIYVECACRLCSFSYFWHWLL